VLMRRGDSRSFMSRTLCASRSVSDVAGLLQPCSACLPSLPGSVFMLLWSLHLHAASARRIQGRKHFPSFNHERTKKFHFENFSFAVLIFNEIFLLFPPNHFIPVASQWNSIAPRWNFPVTRLQFDRRGIITSAHESRRTGCCASFAAIRRPAY
jgi:hypothetical protein